MLLLGDVAKTAILRRLVFKILPRRLEIRLIENFYVRIEHADIY